MILRASPRQQRLQKQDKARRKADTKQQRSLEDARKQKDAHSEKVEQLLNQKSIIDIKVDIEERLAELRRWKASGVQSSEGSLEEKSLLQILQKIEPAIAARSAAAKAAVHLKKKYRKSNKATDVVDELIDFYIGRQEEREGH